MYSHGIKRTVRGKGGVPSSVTKHQTRTGFLSAKFVEFCKRTELHGYKYIVMNELSIVERSCWAFAVVVSIVVAAYFVVTAYRWYARNPIVTVIESTQGAIWDVPFPAVTICDLNMVSRKAAMMFASNILAIWNIVRRRNRRNRRGQYNYGRTPKAWNESLVVLFFNSFSAEPADRHGLKFLTHMPIPPIGVMSLPDNVTKEAVFDSLKLIPLLHSMFLPTLVQKQQLRELQRVLDLNSITMDNLFKSVSPAYHCSDMVQKCMWKNTIYRCEHLFQQVFTLYNLCCTFNYYAVEPDKKDGNGRNYILRKKTPRHVASCGYQTGLTVLLNTNIEDYYSASVASQGALVFIDSAYNVPNHDTPARMVNPSTEVLIALSPERTYATSGIKSFTAEERQCYYSDEIVMADFGVFTRYSLHNCMAYLEVKVVSDVCNCVPFFFPIKQHHRVCNFNDLDCLEIAIKSVDGLLNTTEDTWHCLPECDHFDYPIEVAMGSLANPTQLRGLPFFYDVDLKNQSVLNVFFNDLVSTRYRRDVYLNWQNILAAFGGLLSLMLGFTLISGIDILIFLALRVIYESFSVQFSKTPSGKVHATDNDTTVNIFFRKANEDVLKAK